MSGLVPSLVLAALTANAASPERQQVLDDLLVHDCGSCHGTRLLGGLGPPLTPQRMRRLSRDVIVSTILEGRAGTAMPPWRALLTPADAAWLAHRLVRGRDE